MNKPAFWIWLLAAPVLTGMILVALLLIPSIQPELGKWIVGSTIASMLLSIPFAWQVSKVFA